MSEVGISKTTFILGIVIAILASSIISTAVSMQWAQGPQGLKGEQGPSGPQGEKGDKGDTGDTGSQGPRARYN